MSDNFRITRVDGAKDLPLPRYMTPGAAGMDLYANVLEDVIINPGQTAVIPTGIAIALPPSFEAQMRPRSGLAYKNKITMFNSVGTIDSDYRGELNVLLINHGSTAFIIKRGDRVAQLIINKIERIQWDEQESLDPGETVRGENGFGSTGIPLDRVKD